MNRGPERQKPRWPHRWVHIAVSLPLSLAAPLGFLVLECARSHARPGISAILQQLSKQPEVYAYIFLCTLLMLAVWGWWSGRKEDRLEQMSGTDPLTGLANRRQLESLLVEETNRTKRYHTPLALLLIDLDRMKDVNDRFGHSAGDQALQVVAEALRQNCRASDLAARQGGDEFAVLAVNTTAAEALALAQRILASVTRLSGEKIPLSVSIGVSDVERAGKPAYESLLASADRALYQAKNEGRGTAVIAPEKTKSAGHLRLVPALPSTPSSPPQDARGGHLLTRG